MADLIDEDGWLYYEISMGMYGIPEAGRLANDLLRQTLKKFGYYETTHTPGFWKHLYKPISWTLIVDDFGFKYTDKRHIDEFLEIMAKWYVVKMDWLGSA